MITVHSVDHTSLRFPHSIYAIEVYVEIFKIECTITFLRNHKIEITV